MGLFDKILGKTDKIKVQFIDNSNGQTIGISEMQADQLPNTFSVSTTMHIQEFDWTVEQAIPENSEEFIKSKQLVLRMRKVEYVNPKELKFSIPTLENSFPNLTEKPSFSDFTIQIHGDDWLQQEFISAVNTDQIEKMLGEIKESAKENNDNGEITSYEKCFVRQFPTIKIKDKIYLTEIKKQLETDKIGALSFSYDYQGFAENTFVIEALGTYFYGQLGEDNSLLTFAVYDIGSVNDTKKLENLSKILKINFVDWIGLYQIK